MMLKNLKESKDTGKLATELSHLAHTYVSSYRPTASDLKKHRILKELRKNKNIVILKPDKGNGVVILDRVEYDKGLFKIINDTTKFRVLTSDPTLTREGKLQRYLRELKKKGHFDPDVYETIYPSGSQPARIYGLPKMHKPRAPNSTPPFRPIVSSIGTYNYSLAKYLSNLLQPHIPSTFIASDSFTFVKEINDLSLHGMFMVSFDVESLFTNIPLDDCIDLAVKYITEGNPGLKLSKNELKRLFEFATKETNFLFKGNFYDQVDGVAMGSPLAPVLANLFMGHHENIWLDQYGDSETAVKGGKTQPYSGVEPQETPKFFFKIPYVGHFSVTAQRSIRKLANRLCKPIDLRVQSFVEHPAHRIASRSWTLQPLSTR
ncbi:uncharacterized protein [Porites lutea]|uniref:uncharacterized protein n=1 Tax=Porites lutea TaxID=51062 RepID=UPI003CC5DD97